MISENINDSRKQLIENIINNDNKIIDSDADNSDDDTDSYDNSDDDNNDEYDHNSYRDNNIDIDEKHSHIQVEYKYLEDNVLSRLFGEFSESPDSRKNVFICPYIIIDDCEYPFIKYAMDVGKNDTGMTFVQSHLQIPLFPESQFSLVSENMKDNDDEDEFHSQTQVFFMNHCIESLLVIMPSIREVIDYKFTYTVYKGFIEDSFGNVFVFFDCTTILDPYDIYGLPENMEWVLIDQIVYNNTDNENIDFSEKVDATVRRLFLENPILEHIRDNNNNIALEGPICLYPCIQSTADTEFSNIYSDRESEYRILLINSEPVNLSFFGSAFVFSAKPVNSVRTKDTDSKKLRKCAVFTKNSKRIIKNAVEVLNDDEISEFVDRIKDLDVMSLYFYNNGNRFWAIKPPSVFTEI